MENTSKVKVGLIGLGNMGSSYVRMLKGLENVDVVGVCDIIKAKSDKFALELDTKAYYEYTDLFDKSGLEAVIIVVPHYAHTPIAIEAFSRGLHVLCEKPVAVHVNDANKMTVAYEKAKFKNPDIVYALGFMERTYPFHKKLKDLIQSGELGKLLRVTWINTAWFRSQAYFESSNWRATWSGEGGGTLVNQCPHNLDLYQWLFGVPRRITGFASLGKYHDIEVEDEVTAYFEHDNGMIGHFIVTTAETPGTNRLEIVGENGNLIYEKGKLIFNRNRVSMLKFSKETKEGFGNVECWSMEIPVDNKMVSGHPVVIDKFIKAIINGGGELVCHGTEGVNSVTIANAIMLSSFTHKTVITPLNGDEYENKLKELTANSKFVKKTTKEVTVDMSKSFTKA